jgi:glycosyltransferase involved in cell wall biosynthesis
MEASSVKVAFVLGTTAGGTGRHVRMLADGCAAREIAAVVFAPGQAVRDFAPGAAAGAGAGAGAGVTWERVEFGDRPRVLRDGRAAARLRRLIARSGADIVHAHGLRAGALAAIALAFAPRARTGRGRLPLVVTVHNAPPASGVTGTVYRVLELIVARNADEVLCVSADLEARMRRAGAGHTGRALVAAPGPSRGGGGPAAAAAAVRAELGADVMGRPGGPGAVSVPSGSGAAGERGKDREPGVAGEPKRPAGSPARAERRPVVLAAGRLAPQKGFAVLLEAAARWRADGPVPLLAIAGDGPLAGPLAAAAAPLGDAVRFLGRRDDVPVLLAAADVVVVPSLWEGQPLIVQEALRAGRPLVVSRAGGIPDLTGEDAAVLVPPGDPERLAAAVRSVLADPALAARLGRAARERARRLPSDEDAVDAALACYRRVLTRRQPPG